MGVATGREMEILKIVSTLEAVDAATISRKMVVSLSYAQSLCNSLVEDGYLQENKGIYKVTPAGERVLKPYSVAQWAGGKYIHA